MPVSLGSIGGWIDVHHWSIVRTVARISRICTSHVPFWSVPKIQIECRFDRPWRFSNTRILFECSYLLPKEEMSSPSICHVRRLPLNGIFVAHRLCTLETTVSLFLLAFCEQTHTLYTIYSPTPFSHICPSFKSLNSILVETISRTDYWINELGTKPKDRHKVIS